MLNQALDRLRKKYCGLEVNKRIFHTIHQLKNKKVVIAKRLSLQDALSILRGKKKLQNLDDRNKNSLRTQNLYVKGPYIYDIHEKCPIFAPPPPPPFFCLSEWVQIGQDHPLPWTSKLRLPTTPNLRPHLLWYSCSISITFSRRSHHITCPYYSQIFRTKTQFKLN